MESLPSESEYEKDSPQSLSEDDMPSELRDSDPSSAGKRSRGRPRIPEAWTRVISVKLGEVIGVRIYEVATDLIMASAQASIGSKRRSLTWKPLFFNK